MYHIYLLASWKWTRVITCLKFTYLWPPYVIGQAIYIFTLWFFLLFSSPNLSGRILDVYHTSTRGVALV